ncbi:MAG: GNAT family N-acetyltransferase, partial [Polyangiaceae bacterium]
PFYRAILSHMSGDARAAAVVRVKTGFTAASVRGEEAHGLWVDGQLAGASLVCAPGQYPHRIGAYARIARGCATTGWKGITKFLRADAYITKLHIREAHYYLFVLGIDPSLQRQGLGKVLLRALSERADARGVPSYLETDKPTSVHLYRSAGYEVLTEGDVESVPGLHVWTMMRPARASVSGSAPGR